MRSITLPPPSEWQCWPRVYDPWTTSALPDMPPRFSVAAPDHLFEPEELVGVRCREGRVTIATQRRPEVLITSGQSIDWLVAELARRDARNLSRDSLLAEHQLRIWFERHTYSLRYAAGVALVLKKVQIL